MKTSWGHASIGGTVLLLLTTTGCGSSTSSDGASASTSRAGQPSASASAASSKISASAPTEAGSGEDLPSVPMGKPYTDPSGVKFTLNSSQCGVASVPSGETDENNNPKTYSPPSGKTLCVAKWSIENTGNAPVYNSYRLQDVYLSEKTFTQSLDDETASRYTGSANTSDLNPGDKDSQSSFFTVPKGSEATGYLLTPIEVGTDPIVVLSAHK